MKKILVMMLAVVMLAGAWCTPLSAAVLIWALDVDNDWNNPANWTPDGVIVGPVPGALDHAIIFQSAITPLIAGGAAPTVSVLTPSWFDAHTSAIDIGPGGSIGASNFARLSAGNSSSSTVNFLPGAGVSVWSVLQMSFNNADGGLPLPGNESDSFINLDGGILHLGSLSFVNNGLNTTNIDIGAAGTLLVNGDLIASGLATTYINSDYITALDDTGIVNAVFDAPNGRTVFTAIAVPEPASLVLLGLGCLGVLMIRKRR